MTTDVELRVQALEARVEELTEFGLKLGAFVEEVASQLSGEPEPAEAWAQAHAAAKTRRSKARRDA